MKTNEEIREDLNNLGLVYITTQCIDIDIQNMGNNAFNSVDDVLDFYRTQTKEEVEKIYIEYYLLDRIDK